MRAIAVASVITITGVFSTSALADTRISRGFVPVEEGVKVTEVAGPLAFPWGLAALPDGTLLVMQIDGDIRVVKDGQLEDRTIKFPVEVMTERKGPDGTLVRGQGGLLDIVTSPDFENDKRLYFTYAKGTLDDNRTAIALATWTGEGLEDFEEIFSVSLGKPNGQHFGSRLAFLPDGTLLATIGDGGNPPVELLGTFIREQSQNLQNSFGTVIRIAQDGSVPEGNPFAGVDGAKPEIWSLGHRNAQGIAVDPETGAVWLSEHGPLGGDELNLLEKGKNYGWPGVTYGRYYHDGSVITPWIEGPLFTSPVLAWVDTHAPGGLHLYTGSAFPAWKGDLLSAGLASRDIRRLDIEDGKVTGETRIPFGTARVRGFAEAPDGTLYVVTGGPEGRVLRLDPSEG